MPIDLGHIPQRRIVCVHHIGGAFVLQPGVEPTVETECAACQVARLDRERRRAFRRNTAWQRWRARTPEELAAAGNPFEKLRGK